MIMVKWTLLFFATVVNDTVHSFGLSCDGKPLSKCKNIKSVSPCNIKPEREKSPLLDRILSKERVDQTKTFPVPIPSTKSNQGIGLCASIFLQPDGNNKINHQQPFLFPRTLSTEANWRKPKTQLSLYQLSHLRLSPFPYPLGQGSYYQNLFCLKKKAKLSSLIHLARVFKRVCIVDSRNKDENNGESSTKKRRLMKGLFRNNNGNRKLRNKKMKIIQMKDETNLLTERGFAPIGQNEMKPLFDLDLAALTISRESPHSVKYERFEKHPPYLEIKIPRRSVLLTATWDPNELKPSGIVRESRNPGIVTLLALGQL